MKLAGVRRGWMVPLGVLSVAMALLASTALAGVSVGHSGWTWASPEPQGNDLSGIDFAGGRGYASGTLGTLLRTDDGGASWTGIATGLTQPLLRVRAIDANTVVIGGGCALRRSDDGGTSFHRLPWTSSDTSCPSQLASFSFPVSQTGYLLTDTGSVFRTDDGGQSFSSRTSVPGTLSAGGNADGTDIFFTGTDTGVAVAGNRIFHTIDGGQTWTQVKSGFAINAVTFVNSTVGYAVGTVQTMSGTNPAMLSTGDGGQTWTPVALSGADPGLDLTSLDCANTQTCLITESTGAQVLRTTDGGATVTAISPSTQAIYGVAFDTPSQAVAIGRGGTTAVSTDGGMNFSPVGGGILEQNFGAVTASPAGIATAGANNGVLARSTDNGRSWSTVGVPTPSRILSAWFPTAGVGYALDQHGGLFKTINGGSSWTVLNTGTSAKASKVVALNPKVVILVQPRGLRRSTDGGSSFKRVTDSDVAQTPLSNVERISGSAAFATGRNALVTSTDDGKSWSKVPLPVKRFTLTDADMVTSKVGYVSGTESRSVRARLLKTTDGGKTWTNLPAIGAGFTGQISFSSAKHGFAGADIPVGHASGDVLATKDGGQTWQPQLIDLNPVSVWDNGSAGLANTSLGSFFFTKTRGSAGIASKLAIKQVKGNAKKARISGTLSHAQGGEQILVSYRGKTLNSDWATKMVTVASNGKFNATIGAVKTTTFVVAQWIGDGAHAGAGTRVLQIQPPKKKQ